MVTKRVGRISLRDFLCSVIVITDCNFSLFYVTWRAYVAVAAAAAAERIGNLSFSET